MKITITYYGVEYTINTKPSVDYMNPDELDYTSVPEVAKAFKSLLLSLTFSEDLIDKTFLNVENHFETDEDDRERFDRILEKIKSEPLKLDQVKTLKIKPCGLEI
jgi:hypothetical protein